MEFIGIQQALPDFRCCGNAKPAISERTLAQTLDRCRVLVLYRHLTHTVRSVLRCNGVLDGIVLGKNELRRIDRERNRSLVLTGSEVCRRSSGRTDKLGGISHIDRVSCSRSGLYTIDVDSDFFRILADLDSGGSP